MAKKPRLGLYLEDEKIKKLIKIAAAKRGLSTTVYCTQAIEERLRRDGDYASEADKKVLLSRMDRFREEIGPIGLTSDKLIKEGRRR
jgi:hypothetical protein